eukprot:15327992-Ditylum_brightwellii.AAC.1
MQHNAQLWSDLLWLSGSLLELDKCSYHFIYYCFLADGTPIMRSQCTGPSLDVTQSSSKAKTTIEYKSPYTPYKILGHYNAPAGAHTIQKEKFWAQHQTGWHTSTFHDVKTLLPYFESRWFKSMQKYLAKIEAWLEMTEVFVYPPQQLRDEHIMSKDVLECDNVIQYCAGRQKNAYPNEISWRLWQKAMKFWTQTRTLPKSLGRWMVSSCKLYLVWPVYYEYPDGCLYAKWCDRYVQYSPDKENIHLFVNGKESK